MAEDSFDTFFKTRPPVETEPSSPISEKERERAREIVGEDVRRMLVNLEDNGPKYPELSADVRAFYSLTKIIIDTSSLPPDQQVNAMKARLSMQNSKRGLHERMGRLLRILGPRF